MTYDSTEDTKDHIKQVHDLLGRMILDLARRAEVHDASKLEDPEKSAFDRLTPRLRSLTYGSDEYKESLDELGDALKHHYRNNRHHPEHHRDGILGMTLVDVVEMFCDWCAATLRHEDGDICDSIERNMGRFGFGPELACIFMNTAQEYQMGRGGHRASRYTIIGLEGSGKRARFEGGAS